MNAIRRHLTAIGIAWLVFQTGVLAVSPFIDCCAPSSRTAVEDDDCCKGMAPGQMCPLHKHRHAPPPASPDDGSKSRCALRSGCGTTDPALLSFGFGLGILEAPVSLEVNPVSNPVSMLTPRTISRAHSLDPPHPRG